MGNPQVILSLLRSFGISLSPICSSSVAFHRVFYVQATQCVSSGFNPPAKFSMLLLWISQAPCVSSEFPRLFLVYSPCGILPYVSRASCHVFPLCPPHGAFLYSPSSSSFAFGLLLPFKQKVLFSVLPCCLLDGTKF